MHFRTGASALNCVLVRRRWGRLAFLRALSSKREFLSLYLLLGLPRNTLESDNIERQRIQQLSYV